MPGSPTSITSRPWLDRVSSRQAFSAPISRWRPTKVPLPWLAFDLAGDGELSPEDRASVKPQDEQSVALGRFSCPQPEHSIEFPVVIRVGNAYLLRPQLYITSAGPFRAYETPGTNLILVLSDNIWE